MKSKKKGHKSRSPWSVTPIHTFWVHNDFWKLPTFQLFEIFPSDARLIYACMGRYLFDFEKIHFLDFKMRNLGMILPDVQCVLHRKKILKFFFGENVKKSQKSDNTVRSGI